MPLVTLVKFEAFFHVEIYIFRSSNCRKTLENSSSDDEIGEFATFRRSTPKTQATNEYKLVMDSLRKKSYDSPGFSKTDVSTSKRSAYVLDQENVDDDWLEDDMKDSRTNKKRKMGEKKWR